MNCFLSYFRIIKKIPRFFNRIEWLFHRKYLKKIGENSHVSPGFSLTGHKYISIGDNFSAGENLKIHTFDNNNNTEQLIEPQVWIGNDVVITDNCYISCAGKITIGDGVLFGSNVFITDNFHGKGISEELGIPPCKRDVFYKGKVEIGNNVWIGRNVCIMPNVSIGDGVIIGANAVVTHNIPAYCVVGGVPAEIIRK